MAASFARFAAASDFAGVRALAEALRAALAERWPDRPGLAIDLELAVVEAANNIVEHGRPASDITLALALDGDWLVASLEDDGPRFDPLAGPALRPGDEEECGRGRSIIAALVDRCAYARRGPRNCLELACRLG